MPHVSADGLALFPYVNVAFQREEIGRRRGTPSGCWIPSSNVHTYFNFSLVIEA